ncbi:alcohol dehydrogenase catalytic domain-containing protein [bacterium LRH843]|nr:alcohol dehydrogenase catalytic domain-containing protein [bacterium LRH843]
MGEVKAAVITEKSNIVMKAFSRPVLSGEDLLVKVEMCGVCGSDLHIFQGDWGEPYPLIPGHEFIGRVEELGENAAFHHNVKLGDRVAIEMILPCGTCKPCRAGLYNLCVMDQKEGRQYGCNISTGRKPSLFGGWAEYLYVPKQAIVHRIPEHVPLRRAVLTEPLAVAVRAVNLTPPRLGDSVVVVGAGPIGLMTVVAAKAAGAYPVILIGSREERLSLGSELGADFVIDYRNENVQERLEQLTDGHGGNIVFETAGTPTAQRESLDYARVGGTVNYLGLTGNKPVQIDTDQQMTFKELTLQTSFLSAWSYEGAINIIASGKFPIEKMITHEFSLDEVEKAISYSANRTENAIKVAIVP